ncbi:COG1361 S-layer family protein [Candidatus Nanohalobium constans]|uniref:S-layer domain protein n=1 Tax=Candidatus Nanohalobium constans TaxID=2565781 RepID=A0A5Q0UGF9_9ARCH|nr:CARDB domain-containing protein [Candidatus Nanohalobium constans]QGA80708.1 S-layer domain protein [Candidatus Nanohalobium constans]
MKRNNTHSTALKIALTLSIITVSIGAASSAPKLDAVSFDPGFITAGDRVNISANMHETDYPDKNWDEDKHLKVVLKPDNRLTREYITIEDDRDESIGFLYPNGVWNQRYQVKVDSGAPTGMYDFELHIQYLENGEPIEIQTEDGDYNFTVIRDFSMPVDNEGVDLSSNVVSTQPSVPRRGDNYVEAQVRFTNTGNKPVEEIDLRPSTPEGIQPSYSSDEKFYINKLMEGDSAEKTISFNLDEDLEPGLHTVDLSATYEDESGNSYSEGLNIPLRVEGRPDLEIVNSSMEMKAGDTSQLRVNVRNTGEQDAESVTARVIAERSQPFGLEDRSNYIGEIESGETSEAVMKISADRSASLKRHQLKVQFRANGDSEEGDQSVYTFTEQTGIELTGRTQSPLIYIGVAAAFLVLAAIVYRYRSGRSQKSVEGGD